MPVSQEVPNQFRVASGGPSQAVSLIRKSQTFEKIVMDSLVIELACWANWGLDLADLM